MYYITETQNLNDVRQGYQTAAKTLSGAKRVARRHQYFQGTTLSVFDDVPSINGRLLAYTVNGRWVTTVDGEQE